MPLKNVPRDRKQWWNINRKLPKIEKFDLRKQEPIVNAVVKKEVILDYNAGAVNNVAGYNPAAGFVERVLFEDADPFEEAWYDPKPVPNPEEYMEDGSRMPRISIGADPEFFLKHGNKNISAHGIVPGNKHEPHKLKSGAVQLDGTAVEFNINPAYTQNEFKKNVIDTLDEVRSMVPKKYRFNFSPAVNYNPAYFKKIPSKCKELGCDPDFDAYTYGQANERPDNRTTMRTGAGHLHIGWDETGGLDVKDMSHILDCCLLSKNLDAIFSMIERNWDTDTKRRKMYGKLGAFRPKKYGCEYRSLSNAWVRYPKLYPFIFDICRRTYAYTVKGKDIAKSFNLPGTLTPEQFNAYCRRVGVFTSSLFPTDFNTEVYGA